MAKLAIIQLSDIHFTNDPSRDHLLSKLPALIARVGEDTWDSDHVVLLFAGDITNEGTAPQYKLVDSLSASVLAELTRRSSTRPTTVIAIPGNHDNDLSGPSTVRDPLLLSLDTSKLDEHLFDTLSDPQTEYRAFVNRTVSHNFKPTSWREHLWLTRTIELNNVTIGISLVNSSWACRRRDPYGSPRLACLPESFDDHDLNVIVSHHPFEWCNQVDVRNSRTTIEQHADLLLTGHVHSDRHRQIAESHTQHRHHIESGCLQDPEDAVNSSFRLIYFDTISRVLTTRKYAWDGASYEIEAEADPFDKDSSTVARRLGLVPSFAEHLSSLGTTVKHPRVGQVLLESLFIMPRLARQDTVDRAGSLVRGEAVIDELLKQGQSMIIGAESSGKSTLAKMLFRTLSDRGKFPILVDANNIELKQHSEVSLEIRRLIGLQYLSPSISNVTDATKSQRVIIIDDLHRIAKKEQTRANLLNYLHGYADTIVLLVPETFIVDELTSQGSLSSALSAYTRYSLLEMSNKLRHQLIQNWFCLGVDLEEDADAEQVSRSIELAATAVGTALERQYMPSFPVFVLSLLQSLDATDSSRVASTSYGHLFEAMIYQQLGDSPHPQLDIDLRVNYLANLAAKVFFVEGHFLGGAELQAWHAEFCVEYKRKFTFESVIASVERAGIVKKRSDGVVFAYPYLLCFFMAKFLANDIYDANTRQIVHRLISDMHRDEYAQTLICLCHLSKDPFIVDAVIQKTESLLSSEKPFEIVADSAALDKLLGQLSEIVIAESPEDRRAARDRLLDSDERRMSRPIEGSVAANDYALSLQQELNASYRGVQIVGQILKTFSGSMRGREKRRLAKAGFDMARRTLASLTRLVQEDADIYVTHFAQALSEEELDFGQITDRVRMRLAGIVRGFGIAVVKHVSNSMGSLTLEPVFDELRSSDGNSVSVELLVFGIELDHYRDFPLSSLEHIMDRIQGSIYGESLVQYLVWLHLVLFNVRYDIRQRACSVAKIKISERHALNAALKRTDSKQRSSR